MSWQFVYNSFLNFSKINHIDEAAKIAKIAGYKFFTHNNKVYFITQKGHEDTGISVEELF